MGGYTNVGAILPSQSLLQSIANPPAPPNAQEMQLRHQALLNAQQQGQIGQLDIQGKQRELQAQQALNDAMQNSLKTNSDGSTSFDHDAIANSMIQRGFGHLVPGLQESWTKADQAKATLNETKQKITDLQTKAQGELRDHIGLLAQGIADHNYDPQAAINALAHSDLDPAKAQQFVQQIQANPTPEAIKALIDPLREQSPAVQKLLTERQTAGAHQTQADTGVKRLTAELPGIAAETQVKQGNALMAAKQNAASQLERVYDPKDLTAYTAARAALPADVQAAFPETPKALGDIRGGAMTAEQKTTAAQKVEELRLAASRNAIEQTKAGAQMSLAKSAQADRELNSFSKPYQTSLAAGQNQLERIGEAQQMLNSNNAETQALAIPKVLSALVSGQGSGVRITQPELNAIGNARGITGDVEGWMNKLATGKKLTGDQTKQLQGILADVGARINQKVQISNDAINQMQNAPDRNTRLAADQASRAKLNSLESGGGPGLKVGQQVNLKNGKTGTIKTVHPDGSFDLE